MSSQQATEAQSVTKQPHEYDRRILVAVSGLSPAILTETIFGLANPEEGDAFVPTEVHLITTSSGKTQAAARLLNGEAPAFSKMVTDYPQLANIAFSESNIHVICDTNNNPIDDLIDQANNETAADFICSKIFEFTRDNEASVHVSIAGGRKTMGFYVGYALSLFGRGQDRLSHVLVSNPYEQCKEFYYPTPYSKTGYYEQGGKDLAADFKDARVDLAQIPFVRITNLMKKSQYEKLSLVKGKISYSETIRFAEASAQESLDVEINPNTREVCINGIHHKVSKGRKAGFVFLTLFLKKIRGDGAILMWDRDQRSQEWGELYLEIYGEFTDVFALDEKDKEKGITKEGMSYDKFGDLISKARALAKDGFGLEISQKLLPKPEDSVFRVKNLNLTVIELA